MIHSKLTGRRRHRVGLHKAWFKRFPILVLQVEVHRTGHAPDHHGNSMDVDEKVWRDARVEDMVVDEIGRVE